MSLVGSSKRSPVELVSTLDSDLTILENDGIPNETRDKTLDDISNALSEIKYNFEQVEGEDTTEFVAQISQEFCNINVFLQLMKVLGKLNLEAQNDAVHIISTLLRRQVGARVPVVDFLKVKKQGLFILLKKYESPNFVFNDGVLLRECMRYEPLAEKVLFAPEFFELFKYIEMPKTDIAADAFETFKFLGELLLNRHNFDFMTRYIGNVENLELIMQMLIDRRIRGIQLGAFNVFKVFVANPEKTPPVHDLLLKNKDDLVEFLTEFFSYSTDEQFNDEKSIIIQSLRALQP
ncbi:calcium-binding protein 39-like isoform X2 [Lytechinus pictus]|uniref:calcium-binding protein 39-like isoform X2 n=1 Tax=Lytechinus pictus TaxID=7653 RepID=UPI0030B9C6E8